MKKSFFKKWRFDKILGKQMSHGLDLPCPINMTSFWKFGMCLLMFLLMQMISGLFLALCFSGDMDLIIREINYGWLVRNIHSKGASFFFMFLYIHMSRGLYYFSFYYMKLWYTGMVILFLSMAVGFFGYMLPWGQMSYWAATVITNLFSIMPYMGMKFVQWLWGGFAVGYPTLTRFFSLHFLGPFMILLVVIFHMIFLHETGSSNPLGLSQEMDKMTFFPYFIWKDFMFVCLFLVIYFVIVFFFPFKIMKTAKFLEANPLVTPEHIEPEWYLLAPYTILRSMPKKVGGVLMLLNYFLTLIFLPFYVRYSIRGFQFSFLFQVIFFFWIFNYLFLTWGGAVPPEFPFLELTQLSCFFHFLYFVILGLFSII